MINNQYFFIGQGGTLKASAADLSLSNHVLAFTGTPRVDFRKLNGTPGWKESLQESLQSWIYTPTAANSTTYSFVIQQWNAAAGRLVNVTFTYQTQPSGDTATTICAAFRAQLLNQTSVQVTGSGTATLILTANAGYPLFTVTNGQPTTSTITANQTSVAIVSSTDATPIVVTTAASTYVVGMVVTIAGHTTNTNANGTWRVGATNGTTTVTLENSVGTGGGAGGATGTVLITAQQARGTYAAILAQVPSGQIPSGVASTQTYAQFVVNYISEGGETNGMPNLSINRFTLFVNEGATNYATFKTRINEVIAALGSGLTTPDPATLALAAQNLGGL